MTTPPSPPPTSPEPTPPASVPPAPTHVVDRLLLDAGPYLSCEECFERLDGYAESRLAGGPPADDLEAHLVACPACAEDVASLTALLQADAGGRPPRRR